MELWPIVLLTVCVIWILTLLFRFPNHRFIPWYVYIFCACGYMIGFTCNFMLPFDVYSAIYTPDEPTGTEKLWSQVYWTAFIYSWGVGLIIKEWVRSGHWHPVMKVLLGLKRIGKFYGQLAIIFGIGVIYLVVRKDVDFDTLYGLLISLSNTYGTVMLVLTLSGGIVNIPRDIWRTADPQFQLKVIKYRAVGYQKRIAHQMKAVNALSRQQQQCLITVPRTHPLSLVAVDVLSTHVPDDMMMPTTIVTQHRDVHRSGGHRRRPSYGGGVPLSPDRAAAAGMHPMREEVSSSDLTQILDTIQPGAARDTTTIHRRKTPSFFSSCFRTFVSGSPEGNTLAAGAAVARLEPLNYKQKIRCGRARRHMACMDHSVAQLDRYSRLLSLKRGEMPPSLPPGYFEGCSGAVRLIWCRWGRSLFLRVSSVVAGLLSALLLLSELLLLFPSLKPYSPLRQLVLRVPDTLTSATAALTFLYMMACVHFSFFRLRLGNFYEMAPLGTDVTALFFNARNYTSMMLPLGWNYLTILGMEDTGRGFASVMSKMSCIPIFGTDFSEYFPATILLLVLLNFSNLGGRMMRAMGIGGSVSKETLDVGALQRVRRGEQILRQWMLARIGQGQTNTRSTVLC
eukprot:gnl/Dysnectes_brevis/4590_a6238_719.p1 GENE.gnl/Dysnectes_brevis/4590_a6238_719~~gnl/Dysnectes_brevis/4590_a6238_719.p1  ORF type:complete len:623 (+),score=92.14 gnl/Dysnectes_brevis/4590_a6238_719:2-1870(+)